MTSGAGPRSTLEEEFVRMVAELTDISTATVGGKASSHTGVTSKQRNKLPRWIQTATREPIYSVLDSDDSANNFPSNIHGKVVVISAIRHEYPSRKKANERNRTSPILEVEDENTLYSVVKKPKKVRLPETSSDEETIRSVHDPTRIEGIEKRQLDLEDVSRRVEVRKWLRDTPRQPLPDPPKMLSDRENPVALPRGVVGLVGPYRIYGCPNEGREYVLQEEELVEEILDSTSEKAQEEENQKEHRQRAKWRIRENDEETLVPDIRDMPRLEDLVETKDGKRESDDWGNDQGSVTMIEKSGCVEKILSGKEERAVDVPDAMMSMKQKRGEKFYLTTIAGDK